MFLVMIGTLVPVMQFAGIINPVTSLDGFGRWFGEIYPATHMVNISRGIFNKGLGFSDLTHAIWIMALSIPVIMFAAIALLKNRSNKMFKKYRISISSDVKNFGACGVILPCWC